MEARLTFLQERAVGMRGLAAAVAAAQAYPRTFVTGRPQQCGIEHACDGIARKHHPLAPQQLLDFLTVQPPCAALQCSRAELPPPRDSIAASRIALTLAAAGEETSQPQLGPAMPGLPLFRRTAGALWLSCTGAGMPPKPCPVHCYTTKMTLVLAGPERQGPVSPGPILDSSCAHVGMWQFKKLGAPAAQTKDAG